LNDSLYMTAEEAADALGVSLATLYAYVSRKNIRTQKVEGGRASRYWREDVERAKSRSNSRTPVAVDCLVYETAITAITEAGPFFRGHSAILLAESHSLEAVSAILWQTQESRVFTSTPPSAPAGLKALWPIFEGSTAIDKAFAAFPLIERENVKSYDLSPEGYSRTAADLMRWFAAMMVGREQPSAEPLHEVVASRSDDPKIFSDLVRRLLVLSADHELEPSTYVVRAIANTGATPYRTVVGAFGAALGQRMAFGKTEALSRLLEAICTSSQPKDVVMSLLREGEPVPGFGGSQRYPQGDPRAEALLNAMNARMGDDMELRRLNAAIDVMVESMNVQAEFSLVNLFLSRRLRLGRQDGLALRLGRIAGWVAHAMEQRQTRPLIRPRAAYVGLLPVGDDV
jgi:citrate synthase